MDILTKIIKFILTAIIDIIVLGGLAIVLAWAIWDVTPQTSITNTAYFFSESWRTLTGKPARTAPITQVNRDQLKQSQKNTRYLYK
jgi:hypothetical protein